MSRKATSQVRDAPANGKGAKPVGIWAIAYDLDVKAMKQAGFTKGRVTMFYNSVRTALSSNGFEKLTQLSIYTSAKENTLTHAFQACQALRDVTDSDKYVKRLHLFRIEDFNDLLPLVANGKASAGRDTVEEIIDEVFSDAA